MYESKDFWGVKLKKLFMHDELGLDAISFLHEAGTEFPEHFLVLPSNNAAEIICLNNSGSANEAIRATSKNSWLSSVNPAGSENSIALSSLYIIRCSFDAELLLISSSASW